MAAAGGLVVAPIPGLLPVVDAREPLRVLVASLAPGGAERIVIEWLAEEAGRAREIELAVPDLLYQGQVAAMDTYRALEVYTVVAAIYVVVLLPLTAIVKQAEKRLAQSN